MNELGILYKALSVEELRELARIAVMIDPSKENTLNNRIAYFKENFSDNRTEAIEFANSMRTLFEHVRKVIQNIESKI